MDINLFNKYKKNFLPEERKDIFLSLCSNIKVLLLESNDFFLCKHLFRSYCNFLELKLFSWDLENGLILIDKKYDSKEKKYSNLDISHSLKIPFFKFFTSNIQHSEFSNELRLLDLFLDKDNSFFNNSLLISNYINLNNPVIVNKILSYLESFSDLNRILVFLMDREKISSELLKVASVHKINSLSKNDANLIFSEIISFHKIHNVSIPDELLEIGKNFSFFELINNYSKAVVYDKTLGKNCLNYLKNKRLDNIKTSKFLDYYESNVTFDDLGGLCKLKEWFTLRKNSFTEAARKFGISSPKGVLLLGIPGTGKSLLSKAIGNFYNLPIIKLDLGKVFGSYVGESEKNMRLIFDLLDKSSPCVLWIDEIEKGLGVSSSNGDSGVSYRIFGSLLHWLQENEKGVFTVATSNNISNLPPELLRKGRFDEIFFIDLPSIEEREHIFSIHINKVKRNVFNFDIKKFANNTEGFSGSEIESVIKESLIKAFSKNEELSNELILECIEEIKPLSVVMKEDIIRMKEWAKDRIRFA